MGGKWLDWRNVTVRGTFDAPDEPIAVDLSGIAGCEGLGRRRMDALVISNEGNFAQFARYDRVSRELEVGGRVPLLPDDPDELTAVGTPPTPARDKGNGRYMLDGEAVAWLAPHYYVTGSHSLADPAKDGGSSTFRRSAYVVARVHNDGSDRQLSFRLSEVLAADPVLAPFFLAATVDNGINIEGLASAGTRLEFGLRGPVIDGEAFIVSVEADALFDLTRDLAPQRRGVRLGPGIGVRDMTRLPDGRHLILSGPSQESHKGFGLHLLSGRETLLLGAFDPDEDLRPEGLLVTRLDRRRDGRLEAELLVLHDHPANGRPRVYEVLVPPP
jgi:hypothetical protein